MDGQPVGETANQHVAPVFVCTELDKDIAARTLFGECRGEPREGQIAVAWVIRTRAGWVPPTWWGVGVRGVCRAPKQFSCWNPDDPNFGRLSTIPDDDVLLKEMREIVDLVFDGYVANPAVVDGKPATHYRRVGTTKDWSVGKEGIRIGHHDFFAIGPGA